MDRQGSSLCKSGDAAGDVLVVVAAYRECAMIGSVVAALRRAGWRVLVVDDGSDDNTADAAWAAGAAVARHPVNLGQGAALRTGFEVACSEPGTNVVVTFDADGQHDADDVVKLVAPIRAGRADAVLGSRFRATGVPAGMPRWRRVALQAVAALQRRSTGLALTDAHNGLRAFSVPALRRLRLTQDRMAHASELVREIARLGLRYEEVPVSIRYTAYSLRKGQRLVDGVSVIWDLLASKAR